MSTSSPRETKKNFITSFSRPDNCRHKSRKNRSNAATGCRSENDGRVSKLHYHIDIGRPHTRFRGAEVLACQHHNIAIDWSDQLWHLKRFAEFSSHRNFHVLLILYVRAMLCVFSAIHDWIQGERRHQRIFQISPEDVKIETALYHGEQGSTKKEKGKRKLQFELGRWITYFFLLWDLSINHFQINGCLLEREIWAEGGKLFTIKTVILRSELNLLEQGKKLISIVLTQTEAADSG